MKKTWLIAALVVPALLASPSPSSGTIVFSAYANLTRSSVPCGVPRLVQWNEYHSGSVYSMDPSDYGRGFRVEGDGGECAPFSPLSSCFDTGTAGIDNTASCSEYFTVGLFICESQVTGYKAATTVMVTDGGGESAYVETPCKSC